MLRLFYILFLFTFNSVVLGQVDKLQFVHYSDEQGLPGRNVRVIKQDKQGFMWVVTQEGLSRFDGYHFKTYKKFLDKPDSWTNEIICLIEDRSGNLIIGTETGGLYVFDRKSEKFTNFRHNDRDVNTPSNNRINALYEDSKGRIWIGTFSGLDLFDFSSHSFTHYVLNTNGIKKEHYNAVQTISEDKEGLLWIGTFIGGIHSFDPRLKQFKYYEQDNLTSFSLSSNDISAIYVDDNGIIWVACWKSGLFIFDKLKGSLRKITFFPEKKHIEFNQFISICDDHKGNLWLGSEAGLYKYNTVTSGYEFFTKEDNEPASLSNKIVGAIYIDNQHGLWVGTRGGGLNYLNLSSQRFRHYCYIKNDPNSLSDNFIFSLGEEPNGNIWVGTNKTTSIFDRKSGTFKKITDDGARSVFSKNDNDILINYLHKGFMHYYNGSLSTIPSISQVTKILPFKKGYILGSYNYLAYYSKDLHSLIYFYGGINDKREIYNVDFFIGNDNTIWVSGWYGLFKFEISDSTIFSRVNNYNVTDTTAFKITRITDRGDISCIIEDDDNNLLLGTNKGLLLYNKLNRNFVTYTVEDGLCSNIINGIGKDSKGNFWLATDYGLCRFTPGNNPFDKTKKEWKARNFFAVDGLQSNSFNSQQAFLISRTGEFIIGGKNGFNIFHPDSIRENTIKPKVVITDFKIFNKSISVGDTINGKVLIKQSIESLKELNLSYKEEVISFEFSSLHYVSPAKNQYAYKLENFDKEWYTTGFNRRYVSYSNLPAGKYIFRVKATNNDGLWCDSQDEVVLNIIISPPFWKTWWFRVIVVLVLIFSVIIIYRVRLSTIKRQKRELEVTVQQRTAEIVAQADLLKEVNSQLYEQQMEIQAQAEELFGANQELQKLNTTKDKFLSIIGHDLKNPMHAIHSLAAMLDENGINMKKEQLQEIHSMLNQSSGNVTVLLENLLTWAQSQSNHVVMNPVDFDISSVITTTLQLLKINADNKGLKLLSEVTESTFVFSDKNMITTVIRNLVNNSIKFTQHGSIILKSEIESDTIKIMVTDTGVGMDEKTKDKLFQIDVHHSSQGTSGEKGTGLGLIICKEFVEKNKGSIRVESEVGKGSSFIIILPQSEKKTTLEEKPEHIIASPHLSIMDVEQRIISHKIDNDRAENTESASQDKPIVLLVEDVPVMRVSIKNILEPKYKIMEASNGREAISFATEVIPDLIISDWMMPIMDGIEFCRQIKTDERTSHVPIIMLTARAASKDKIEGYDTGADDYVTKPCDENVLVARVKNLIDSRKLLREKFSSAWLANKEDKKSGLSEIDIKFLTKIEIIIEQNISDFDFDVEKLSREIGMSRSQLFRKLMALTNLSPTFFIRNYRLRKAASMLSSSGLSVSEVMYDVGFNHRTHFNTNFKKIYGVLPSEYRKRKES